MLCKDGFVCQAFLVGVIEGVMQVKTIWAITRKLSNEEMRSNKYQMSEMYLKVTIVAILSCRVSYIYLY